MIEAKESTACQRLQGLCFVVDTVEHGQASEYASYLYKYASIGFNENDLEINQTSTYALGMLATRGLLPDATTTWLPRFQTLAKAWLERKKMKEQIESQGYNDNEEDDDEKETKQQLIFENAVGAIGKILRNNKPSDNVYFSFLFIFTCFIVETLRWWIGLLPIVEDVEEMTNVVENLLFFVEKHTFMFDRFGPELFKDKKTAEHTLFVLRFYISTYHGAPSVYETIMLCTCDDDDDERAELAMLPVVELDTLRKTFEMLNNLKKVLPSQMFESVKKKFSDAEQKNFQFYFETYCK
ncbi:hypothetical protein RFI_13867 [Reticulomyxa filosa]|uniref:Uncharacterized protein n=1 Tax=Reticulomyxa filosa TaxID=46433 RepID=X6NDB2_RETFI|nr:hypothetical protein RFI_13867 [Reticulomyxa filosa]|eukprot:ETO23317.1 hypothetical protein RFI_13867 [Reticulomyxa filosa]